MRKRERKRRDFIMPKVSILDPGLLMWMAVFSNKVY